MKVQNPDGPWLLLLLALLAAVQHWSTWPGVQASVYYSDLHQLTTSLFSSYKPQLRPIGDKFVTSIGLKVNLKSIQVLDEIDQSLTFSAQLLMRWTDHRLTWTPSTNNTTTFFAYPQKHMWIPDVTISNSVQTMTQLGYDRNYLYVKSTGEVRWLAGGVFKTACSIDVTYYPFDIQTCTIVFSTLVSRATEIFLHPDAHKPANLRQYTSSGSWEISSFTVTPTERVAVVTTVTFHLRLKRRTTYHVIAVLVPVLFLSLTATLVFALPADSGEKMGTSITVLLAFAVYLTIVSDQMPKTSMNTSMLSLYLTVLLGQTAFGVVLSVWILNLHFRDDQRCPPGLTTQNIARALLCLMGKRSRKDRVTPADDHVGSCSGEDLSDSICNMPANLSPDDQQNLGPAKDNVLRVKAPLSCYSPTSGTKSRASFSGPDVMSWREIAFAFDRFLFYMFSVFLCVATVGFLSVLAMG